MRRLGKLLLGVLVLYVTVSYATARLRWIPTEPGGALSSLPSAPPHMASGVIHVHTHRSHDAIGSEAEVAEAASATGLDFVFISDHRRADAPPSEWAERARWDKGVLLVRGQEIRVRDMGYVLVDQVDTAFVLWDGGVDGFVDRLERDSAFAIVAHPRSPRGNREAWQLPDARGMAAWEAFDFVDGARRRLASASIAYHLGALVGSYVVGLGDLTLLRLYREGFDVPGATAFDSIAAAQGVTAVAGIDMHPKTRLPWGSLLPAYEPFFRSMVNHVALDAPLDDDAGQATRQLTSAIRNGTVHISFGDTEPARGFHLGVAGHDPRRPASGTPDPTEPDSGPTLEAGFEDDPGRVAYRVLRDGREVGWWRGPELGWTPGAAGLYRVEVYRYSARVGNLIWNPRAWIFTNPIEVRRGTAADTGRED